MSKFKVFHRTWWRRNEKWPNGLEPCVGGSRTIGFTDTEERAREMCAEWNAKYKTKLQRELSDKAEYTGA